MAALLVPIPVDFDSHRRGEAANDQARNTFETEAVPVDHPTDPIGIAAVSVDDPTDLDSRRVGVADSDQVHDSSMTDISLADRLVEPVEITTVPPASPLTLIRSTLTRQPVNKHTSLP